MNNQFSQRVSDIIIYSKEEANRLRSEHIGPGHLLLEMLRDDEGKAVEILSKLSTNLAAVKQQTEARLGTGADDILSPDAEIPLSNDTAKTLKMCILKARGMKSNVTGTGHVLLTILRERNNTAASVLETNDVNHVKVLEQVALQPDISSDMRFPEGNDDEEISSPRSGGSGSEERQQQAQAASKKPASDTPVLDNFGTGTTKVAEEGCLDPVVNREKEVERLAQILNRHRKNSPILIDEPGVGGSAIVGGLALRIIQKKVSRILFDERVVALDMTAVMTGAKCRGQFEERIRSILNELQRNPNIILFISEIHTIVGTGSTAGSVDTANMLKPTLAHGETQCIGATTLGEYHKNIEKDGALERCFQKAMVEPVTAAETLQTLRNIRDKYEDHHNVNYTDGVLEACIKLTDRYITDHNFPDKTIDALNEAGSHIHPTNVNVPKEIEEQERPIEEAKNKKNEAVKSQNFEFVASFRDREKELTPQLDEMKREWESSLKENRQTVDAEEVASIISMISGTPVQCMAQAEGIKLADIKEGLQSKVIAQDPAIEKLVKAILGSRVGLEDPNKPIGTFMFLGPTGVGKTHLTKELARYMFGSSDALVRIGMSEFMEKFTVSRPVGAPPGYVGYEEGGQLTEEVCRKPYSIVLLDEIEKTHSDMFSPLLQVMDEGHLAGSYGRVVDFKNTVIIMTFGVGTHQLKEPGRGVGFATQSHLDNKEFSQSVIQKALNKSFAPEFISRVDEIIIFDQLSLEAVTKIIDIKLKGLYDRVKSIGYRLVIDDEAKRFVVEKGYGVQFGTRPLKRAIQTHLEDGLSELVITSSLKEKDVIQVSLNKEKGELEIKAIAS